MCFQNTQGKFLSESESDAGGRMIIDFWAWFQKGEAKSSRGVRGGGRLIVDSWTYFQDIPGKKLGVRVAAGGFILILILQGKSSLKKRGESGGRFFWNMNK